EAPLRRSRARGAGAILHIAAQPGTRRRIVIRQPLPQISQRRRPAGGSQRAGAVSRPARHPNPPGLLARAADLAPDSPRAADQSGRFPDAGGSRISSVCHHARVVRPRRERDCRAGNQPISRRDAGARRGRAPGEGQSSPAVDLRAEVRPQRAGPATGRPSTYTTWLVRTAGTVSPGTIRPTRLSGSVALSTTRSCV